MSLTAAFFTLRQLRFKRGDARVERLLAVPLELSLRFRRVPHRRCGHTWRSRANPYVPHSLRICKMLDMSGAVGVPGP